MASLPCKIFLSYGRNDASNFAERIDRDLKGAGHTVWRDLNDLRAGGWDSQIESAIERSDIMLAILSPHATRRKGHSGALDDSICLDEIAFAQSRSKPIPVIPAMAIATDLPLLLIRQQYLDFIPALQSDGKYQENLKLLLEWIEDVGSTGAARFIDEQDGEILELDPFLVNRRKDFVGRKWLEEKVLTWAEGTADPARVLLLVGEPGIGKTAFFADMVSRNPDGHIIAYHVCRLARRDTLEPARAIRSMSAMARRVAPAYAARLPDLLRANGPLSPTEANANPQRGFEEGFLIPLAGAVADRRAIIFIDALDEALGYTDGTNLVEIIANAVDVIPDRLRIVATTRPDARVMALLGGSRVTVIDTHSRDNLDDLHLYIDQRLAASGLDANTRSVTTARIDQWSNGNFLVARLILNDNVAGGLSGTDPRHGTVSLFGEYTRAFNRAFPNLSTFEPVRQLLGLAVEAFAPLTQSIALRASGYAGLRQLLDAIAPVSSYILRPDNTLSVYHASFAEWLREPSNRYSIDRRAAHESLTTAFAGQFAAWVHQGQVIPPQDRAYWQRYLFDHLSHASAYLDPTLSVGALVQLGLGLSWQGAGTTWPTTTSIPADFRQYVDFICQNRQAEAAALLMRLLNEMVLQLYIDAGLLVPLPAGDSARFRLEEATKGAPVADAFEIAGAMGAIASEFLNANVFDGSPKARQDVANIIASQAHYAGGFEFAGWGRNISGYFEDAGGDLYRKLNEIWKRF